MLRLLIIALLLYITAAAVSLRPEQMYVVYTYNFLQNVKWTDPAKQAAYKVLVLTGNDFLKENFELLERDRKIDGKPITISFRSDEPLKNYHAVFIDEPLKWRQEEVYRGIGDAQTLLISVANTKKDLLMINLLQKQPDQMTFEINRANILNQGMLISDNIVLLGGTDIDVAKLYKKTLLSLEKEEERSRELNSLIKSATIEKQRLASEINAQNDLIERQNLSIGLLNDAIRSQEREVAKRTRTIEAQHLEISRVQKELERLSKQVTARNEEVKEQLERLARLDTAEQQKDSKIAEKNKVLENLQRRIAEQSEQMVLKEQTISSQSSIITLLGILVLLTAALIFFLFKLAATNRRHAERDFMTGLYNRRYFKKKAEALYADAAKRKIPSAAVMIDIDHFKQINDTYGHAVGDEAIRIVAATIQKTLKHRDAVIARWGGEEFMVLTLSDPSELLDLCNTLIDKVAACTIAPHGHEPFRLTVSVGIHRSEDSESFDHLLKEADVMLYRAKASGRNCIIHNL